MPYTGPYVLKPRPNPYYPSPEQTLVAVELGPGQNPVSYEVFIGGEYMARRDDQPIQGPRFTIKPPVRPL